MTSGHSGWGPGDWRCYECQAQARHLPFVTSVHDHSKSRRVGVPLLWAWGFREGTSLLQITQLGVSRPRHQLSGVLGGAITVPMPVVLESRLGHVPFPQQVNECVLRALPHIFNNWYEEAIHCRLACCPLFQADKTEPGGGT